MEDDREYTTDQGGSLVQILPRVFIGTLLVICGFFGGWYWEQANIHDPITVTLVQGAVNDGSEEVPSSAPKSAENTVLDATGDTPAEEDCIFVGSKNSDKFHLAESGTAKRIKPENRVCFKTEEDAMSQGYSEGDIN